MTCFNRLKTIFAFSTPDAREIEGLVGIFFFFRVPDHLSANIFCECDDSSRIIVETDLAVWWHGLDAVIHLAAGGADELEENRVEKKKGKTGRLPSVIRSTSLSAICKQQQNRNKRFGEHSTQK